MTRTETLNRSVRSAAAVRTETLRAEMNELEQMSQDVAEALKDLQTSRAQTVEDLARQLAPLAAAMASLTEETRRTLERVTQQSAAGHQQAVTAVRGSTQAAQQAADQLRAGMLRVEDQTRRLLEGLRDARETPPPSPWPPALVAAVVPLAAVLWLAWRVGVMPSL
ncbi:IncQ-type mobilization protein MobB [Azospirillum sp. B510]|uniref:IncQ-type mobilization protein MobB n=1 Tax=Azospirillum sp. (strain B510) TaxID=137722 RepID=UPI0005AA63CB|nr:IncQ-type mobilization protein MobB [Azospirillum sp. B510]